MKPANIAFLLIMVAFFRLCGLVWSACNEDQQNKFPDIIATQPNLQP